MHDPTVWTSWYVALLLFPSIIGALLIRDFLSQRVSRSKSKQ